MADSPGAQNQPSPYGMNVESRGTYMSGVFGRYEAAWVGERHVLKPRDAGRFVGGQNTLVHINLVLIRK